MPDLSQSLNTFSLQLSNQLSANSNENFFVSPFSILTALAMCYFGAKEETSNQLKGLLHLNEFSDDDQLLQEIRTYLTSLNRNMSDSVSLNTANKIYPRSGFALQNDFVDKIRNGFAGDVQELDYEQKEMAAKIINDWVEAQTAKKITNLISPNVITPKTMMILVNAIYFKGSWSNPFEERRTKKRNFHLLGGSIKQTDMMHLDGKTFKYLYNPFGLECSTLELPYAGDKVAMTIILPNEGVDLGTFQRSLKPNHINNLLKMQGRRVKINVQVPKFKLEKQYEVSSSTKCCLLTFIIINYFVLSPR